MSTFVSTIYTQTTSIGLQTLGVNLRDTIHSSAVSVLLTQGWTLTESKLQAGNFEWDIFFHPATLGTSSLSFYIALGVNSALSSTFTPASVAKNYITVFKEWQTNSKTARWFSPSTNNIVPTNSFFASDTYAYLPGSENSIEALTIPVANRDYTFDPGTWGISRYISAFATDDILIWTYSVTSLLGSNRDTTCTGYAGIYDSAIVNDFPVVAGTITRVSTRGSVVFDDCSALFITDPVNEATAANFRASYNNEAVRYGFRNRFPMWTFVPSSKDRLLQSDILSRVALLKDSVSFRGLFKNLYMTKSRIGFFANVNWYYDATTYSGKCVGSVGEGSDFLNEMDRHSASWVIEL